MGIAQPAGGLAVSHAGAQAFRGVGGSRSSTRFKPGYGILCPGKRRQQRMLVIRLGCWVSPWRKAAGRFEVGFSLGFPYRSEREVLVVFLGLSRHLGPNR
ncbi:MAG: hypothetical protein ACREHV_15860 [Rhizomicrobium sp.]